MTYNKIETVKTIRSTVGLTCLCLLVALKGSYLVTPAHAAEVAHANMSNDVVRQSPETIFKFTLPMYDKKKNPNPSEYIFTEEQVHSAYFCHDSKESVFWEASSKPSVPETGVKCFTYGGTVKADFSVPGKVRIRYDIQSCTYKPLPLMEDVKRYSYFPIVTTVRGDEEFPLPSDGHLVYKNSDGNFQIVITPVSAVSDGVITH